MASSLIPIKSPDYGRRDKNELALELMDKILLAAPPESEFQVYDLIKVIQPDYKKADVIRSLGTDIDRLLTVTYDYASRPTPTQYPISLTKHGRYVKSQGGHFAYLAKLAEKEKAEHERQERKDTTEKIDLKIKQWIYKTKLVPYGVSIAALGFSIWAYFNPINKPKEIQVMQQEIQTLKERLSKQGTSFPLDTLATKRK